MPYLLKKILSYFLSIVLLLFGEYASAQKLTKITFDINSPLKTNTIYDIHFSKDNLLYIATDNGLWSYNGLSFVNYKHSIRYSSEVHCIQENKSGSIFIADFSGNIFRLKEDSLVISPVAVPEKINAFYLNQKYNYYVTQTSIFAESNRTGTVSRLPLPKNIISIVSFSDKGYFYYLQKGPQCVYAKVQDSTFSTIDSNFNSIVFCNNYLDSNYRFDLTKRYLLDGYNNRIIDINKASERLNPYKVMMVNKELFLSCRNGLYLPRTNQLFFKDYFVNELIGDNEGNIWVSTLNRGLHKISSLKNQYYPIETSDSELDLAYVNKNKIIYSDKSGKLYYWDNKKQECILFHTKSIKGQLKNISYDSFKEQFFFSGNKLLITSKDLTNKKTKKNSGEFNVIDRTGYTLYMKNDLILRYGLIEHLTNSILERSQDSLVYRGRIYSFYKNRLTPSSSIRMNPHKSIKGIKLWGGRVVTTYKDSLLFIDTIGYQIKNVLPIAAIQNFFLGNNQLFILTSSHILVYNTQLKLLFKKERNKGLENKISNLSIDAKHICITTKVGVFLLDARTLELKQQFTTENGIASVDFTRAWLFEGNLYVNGGKGLSKIILDDNYNKGKVTLNIDKVLINNIEQFGNVFQHEQNNIELSFDVRSYTTSGRLKWRLDDNSWNEATNGVQKINLRALQSGTYKIEAYFQNNFGERSEVVEYDFVIQKPYWQTWWFYPLIFLFGSSFFALIGWQRMKGKRKEEILQNQNNLLRMQSLQSQMNPHFIFNVQAGIQGLWMRGEEKKALALQNKFSKLLRKIFQYSGQVSISIEQMLDFIENYISLEQIRFKSKVNIDLKIDPNLLETDYFIPPLLIQPIIENSFKHGLLHRKEDRVLIIQLENKDPYLYCIIQDNGVGRNESSSYTFDKKRKPSGLSTTKNRLTLLQKNVLKTIHPQENIRITDLKDAFNNAEGTKVELWIPFVNFQEKNNEKD